MSRFLLLFLLVLSSCGYRLGQDGIISQYRSICIPYVEGDEKGIFTTILIRTMNERSSLAYQSYCADLALNVCLLEPSDENIGFTYGSGTNIVVANEARLKLTAKVTLIDRRSRCAVLGPVEVTSWLDYDFEPDMNNVNANAFSLGQFEMHNMAQDAAFPPLYTLLAEKIVDYVNHSW